MKDLSNLTSSQLQKVYEKVFGLRPVTDNRRFLINNLMMPLELPVKNCIERSTQNPRTSQRKVQSPPRIRIKFTSFKSPFWIKYNSECIHNSH